MSGDVRRCYTVVSGELLFGHLIHSAVYYRNSLFETAFLKGKRFFLPKTFRLPFPAAGLTKSQLSMHVPLSRSSYVLSHLNLGAPLTVTSFCHLLDRSSIIIIFAGIVQGLFISDPAVDYPNILFIPVVDQTLGFLLHCGLLMHQSWLQEPFIPLLYNSSCKRFLI